MQRIRHPSKKCYDHIILLWNDWSVLHTVDTATELDINSVPTKSHSQTLNNSLGNNIASYVAICTSPSPSPSPSLHVAICDSLSYSDFG